MLLLALADFVRATAGQKRQYVNTCWEACVVSPLNIYGSNRWHLFRRSRNLPVDLLQDAYQHGDGYRVARLFPRLGI